MSILELERVTFNVGSIKASGYSAGETRTDGSMINYLSGEEMAEMIGLDHTTTVQRRLSKELRSMLGQGFTTVQGKYKNETNAYTKINCWDTLSSSMFFTYHALTNNNSLAKNIVISLVSTSLDIIINDAFNRKYVQFQAQQWTGERMAVINSFHFLADSIKAYIDRNNIIRYQQFLYSNTFDGVNRGLFGQSAASIKKELCSTGNNIKTLTRDNFGKTALYRIRNIQDYCEPVIDANVNPVDAVKQAVAHYHYPIIHFSK